jgi:hypothetical protein
MNPANCEVCDDADAVWVCLLDGGDRIGANGYAEATAYYRATCDGCKGGYEEPQKLTPEWRRKLNV